MTFAGLYLQHFQHMPLQCALQFMSSGMYKEMNMMAAYQQNETRKKQFLYIFTQSGKSLQMLKRTVQTRSQQKLGAMSSLGDIAFSYIYILQYAHNIYSLMHLPSRLSCESHGKRPTAEMTITSPHSFCVIDVKLIKTHHLLCIIFTSAHFY